MKLINLLLDLISNIPVLLSYFVPGYLFITIFHWMTYLGQKLDANRIILNSIIVSYIIKVMTTVALSPVGVINESIFALATFLVAVIFAVLFARVFKSNTMQNIFLKCGIHRDTYHNIWERIMKNDVTVEVFMKDNTSYLGKLVACNEHERDPLILLAGYQCFDSNGNMIDDSWNNENEQLIINTEGMEKIRVVQYERANKDKPTKQNQ